MSIDKRILIKMKKKKGDDPMQITATEFKLNLGKYLNLVLTEDGSHCDQRGCRLRLSGQGKRF